MEWSGPLSGQPFGGSAIGDSECRIYRERTPNTRAAAAAAAVGRWGIESADNNGRVPQCVPVVRGFLVVTPRPLSWLLFARRRPDVTRLRVTTSKVHVDSFHVNNVKIGIDARAYDAEKLTRIVARRVIDGERELAREFRSDFRSARAASRREIRKNREFITRQAE